MGQKMFVFESIVVFRDDQPGPIRPGPTRFDLNRPSTTGPDPARPDPTRAMTLFDGLFISQFKRYKLKLLAKFDFQL